MKSHLIKPELNGDYPVAVYAKGVYIFNAAGKKDESLCNAAGYPVQAVKGVSFFDTSVSFAMIRKGLIDLTILGGLQVNEKGDLAN